MSNVLSFDVLTAPARIVSDTRADFRKSAMEYLERSAAAGADTACIDLAATEELDASGLGILVLLQKRAHEMKLPVKLLNVPSNVRYLLVLTKLDHLFAMGR